jgi:hypothetical protein
MDGIPLQLLGWFRREYGRDKCAVPNEAARPPDGGLVTRTADQAEKAARFLASKPIGALRLKFRSNLQDLSWQFSTRVAAREASSEFP